MIRVHPIKESTGYALAKVCKAHRGNVGEHLAELGLHAGQEMVLIELFEQDGLRGGELAERLDGSPGVDLVLFREDEEAVVRRSREELRFAPDNGGWRLSGDEQLLDAATYPNGFERAWSALACPN